MCFATTVTLLFLVLDSSNADVRPETPALGVKGKISMWHFLSCSRHNSPNNDDVVQHRFRASACEGPLVSIAYRAEYVTAIYVLSQI